MSLAPDSIGIRLLHTVGITASALVAGANLAVSLALVPAMCLPAVPACTALTQWVTIGRAARGYAAPGNLMAAICYLIVLTRTIRHRSPATILALHSSKGVNSDLLCGAIAANACTILFSVVVMRSRIYTGLEDMLNESIRGGLRGRIFEQRVKRELRWWGKINLLRAMFPLTAAVLGTLSIYWT